MYMWRLRCYRIQIAGGIFAARVVVFAVVRVAVAQEVVGDKARLANGDFGVLALTWMRMLARHRAPSYSVGTVWGRGNNNQRSLDDA
jgi:hypothetical protein